MSTVYDFTVKDRLGNDVSLSEYSGKVLLMQKSEEEIDRYIEHFCR